MIITTANVSAQTVFFGGGVVKYAAIYCPNPTVSTINASPIAVAKTSNFPIFSLIFSFSSYSSYHLLSIYSFRLVYPGAR